MERIPEPELMDNEAQANAYSHADFSASNRLFINHILADYKEKIERLLDIGCGPGDVDIELAERLPEVEITAVDGSEDMIRLARQKLKASAVKGRIEFRKERLPGLDIEPGSFDLIISKDMLHHLPDPAIFWAEMDRLSRDNTIVYLMDLIRPDSPDEARWIVEKNASREADLLQTDFYNSLCAAFKPEEVQEQIQKTSFKMQMNPLGDRHFIVKCWKSAD